MKHLRLLVCLLALPFTSLLAQTLPAPIAYYPFNSGFSDESGNHRDAVGEDVGFTSDNHGNALAAAYFNNQTSLVSALTVNSGQAEYTFSGLVLPYSNSQYTTFLYIGTNSAANGIGIAMKGAGTQGPGNNFTVFAGGRFETSDTSLKIEAFKWQHFVLVKRLDTVKAYVNGVKVFGRVIPNTPSTSPLYIGTSQSHRQAHHRSFNGVMDEVKFFGLALTDAQVLTLFNEDYSTISQTVGILTGQVYLDADHDCVRDSVEENLIGNSVVVNPGGLIVPLSNEGTFSVPVDSGTYSVTIQPTRYMRIDSLCSPGQVNVMTGDSASVSLGIQGQACPLLNVSLSSPARRRCFKMPSCVTVQNLGGFPSAAGIQLVLEYPRLVRPVRYLTQNPTDSLLLPDSVMRYSFTLPAIAGGHTYSLRFTDSTFCRDSATGDVVCTKAALIGVNPCLLPDTAWDHSDLVANARCDADSAGILWLSVRNQGTGSMRNSVNAIILANDGVVSHESIQLSAGDSAVFRVEDHGELWAISAHQSQGHPAGGSAVAAWGGCGTSPLTRMGIGSLLVSLDLGDESPLLDIDCMPIVDSYDPNDKLVTPSGFGDNHIVAPRTRLEYKIRFQNKGTASTVFVTVRDTLSADFDLASFERGGESHTGVEVSQYKFGDRNILQWKWAGLELTPASVNDAASQGFVTFRISPVANLALGTDVANKAGIFFDYNRPVVTDPVKVRFDNLPVTTVPNPVVEPVSAKRKITTSRLVLAPNPAHGSVYLSLRSATASEKIGYVMRDVIGREVGRGTVSGKGGSVSLAGMHEGIYMVTLKAGNVTETRKLVVE